MICKIISGGQAGVDRAALDAAIKLNIPHGGWCPKTRKAEDGVIAPRYLLEETLSEDYSERTVANIRDSHATLILVTKALAEVSAGTLLTIKKAVQLNKPHLIINLSQNNIDTDAIKKWLQDHHITLLNVAGPRESQSPGIYQASLDFLSELFAEVTDRSGE